MKREDFIKQYVRGIDYFGFYGALDSATDDPSYKMILLNLIRQSSKSTWALSVNALYNLFNVRGWQGAGIASSKDVFKSIFRQKVVDIIARSPKLKQDARVFDTYCTVPRLGSYFEIFPAENVGAVVGRSLNTIYIDEAALTDDEVIATLMPSIMAKENCKIVAVSSSWAPRGWFYEMIMGQEKDPQPEVFLYRSDAKDLNKYAKAENLDFMSRTLLRINPAYEKRFLSTEFAEIGDEFIPRAVVDACVKHDLVNATESRQPCYAFLDLSLKRDLTSRVIVEYGSGDQYTAINVVTMDPKGFFNKRIDFNAVKAMIESDYKNFAIRKYLIDERSEAGGLMQSAREKGYYLEPFNATVDRNMAIWGRLLELLSSGKLRIPANKRLLQELYNLRIEEFSYGRSFRVTDASRKLHRDVSMALAGAAWAASENKGVEPAIYILDEPSKSTINEMKWIEIKDFNGPVFSPGRTFPY